MRPFALLARCLLAGLSGALLLPASAHADAGACRYLPIAPIALRGSGPARQPTVDGAIDGQPVAMMFDTGAYTSMLMLHAAERLELNLSQTDRMVGSVAGANNTILTRAAAERAGLRVDSPGVVASGLVKGIGSADVTS